jgi:hypothetical protein
LLVGHVGLDGQRSFGFQGVEDVDELQILFIVHTRQAQELAHSHPWRVLHQFADLEGIPRLYSQLGNVVEDSRLWVEVLEKAGNQLEELSLGLAQAGKDVLRGIF